MNLPQHIAFHLQHWLTKILANRALAIDLLGSASLRFIGATSMFALSLLVSKRFGSEDAGFFFLSLAIVTFLASFSRIGLDGTILKVVACAYSEGNHKKCGQVVKESLILVLLFSSLVASTLFGSAGFIANSVFGMPNLADILKMMSPSIIGIAGCTIVAMGLQGLRNTKSAIFTENIVCNILAIAFLSTLATSALPMAAAFSLSSFFAFTIGSFLYFRKFLDHQPSHTVDYRELRSSCLPLWVVMLMTNLTQHSGQFAAGVYADAEQVAFLAVAQRISMLTSLVLMVVNLVIAPRLAVLFANDDHKALEALSRFSTRLMIIFALPMLLVMLLYPHVLLSFFGEEFIAGSTYLRLFALAQFVNVCTGPVGYLLVMSGNERAFRDTMLISGFLSVLLAFGLSNLYGATGSAIATSIALSVQNLSAAWWVKQKLGFNILRFLTPFQASKA
ncbi:polysaccharide biosynthesis related protein [Rhodopirellula baltica SH28]|uniref:Polysaccharide biosynthesis related protein n=1 Tax=Rhodopirellula baltica SH28 TaxID=993517 RepID=K5DBK9_RHOBT|nr:MATE family efflux transporter [Rhodopirellula baltica]EKJ99822.1 polysaccharide biosynthesis related protein [Rhodopirellula baltica SH28]